LLVDDLVRIYFSTRSVDAATGKFRSHVAFVDMDRALERVIRTSSEPVIPLGGLGTFDEHGIFPMNVLRDGDRVRGYTCGWSRRSSVSVETAIGLAISTDGGLSFTRTGPGPIVAASLHEPFLVGDAFVRVFGGAFHMWYIFGTEWRRFTEGSQADRIYKIGHAVSPDGLAWTTGDGRQIVADCLGPDESQALPSVIELGGRYQMFFCYRESFDFRSNPRRGYRIGRASSDDLENWTREEDPVFDGPVGEWEMEMQCYPQVAEWDGRVLLLYNGNAFGRYGFGAAELVA
jgi:hypothetical protein